MIEQPTMDTRVGFNWEDILKSIKEVPETYDSALRRRSDLLGQQGQQQNAYEFNRSLQAYTDKLNTDTQNLANQAQDARVNASYRSPTINYSDPGTAGGTSAAGYTNTATVGSKNPRTAAQAIEFAKQAAASGDSSWYRRCLAFVATAYGLPGSGTPLAIDAYNRLPGNMKSTDRNPPPGALVYWHTGSPAGHVALYIGNGMVASNDIGGRGKISIVPMNDIDSKWGAKYVGWSQPSFATTPR